MTPRIGDSVPSIEGWGLNNPDPEHYDLRSTGEYAGHCQSETCAHNSHDPYGPVMQLTLKNSRLPETEVRPGTPTEIMYLGETGDDAWYTGPTQQLLLRVRYTQHFNDNAEIVHVKQVPLSIERAYFGMPI